MSDVLVVAFDGLDYDLIQEFDCETILSMEEFGKIDNHSQMSAIKTSELYASFITGKNYQEHGLEGLVRERPRKELCDLLIPKFFRRNIRGFDWLQSILQEALRVEEREFYDKRDLECETIFEQVENSKALFVPGYNPSLFWKKNSIGFSFSSIDYEDRPLEYYWDEWEFPRREKKFFRPVNKWYDFCMMHFHRPDMYQHIYENPGDNKLDRKKLKEVYQDFDDMTERVVEYFGEDYDIIIFMSDHGLPTETEHNENAFYSCNKEIFGNKEPSIMDFHDEILDLINEF